MPEIPKSALSRRRRRNSSPAKLPIVGMPFPTISVGRERLRNSALLLSLTYPSTATRAARASGFWARASRISSSRSPRALSSSGAEIIATRSVSESNPAPEVPVMSSHARRTKSPNAVAPVTCAKLFTEPQHRAVVNVIKTSSSRQPSAPARKSMCTGAPSSGSRGGAPAIMEAVIHAPTRSSKVKPPPLRFF